MRILLVPNTLFMGNYYQPDGYDTEQCRLRTKRQKRRILLTDKDRQLRKLDKERRVLFNRIRELGWKDLTPPIQAGWKRNFVLRHDVQCGLKVAFYQELLDKINTFQYSDRKDFTRKRKRFGYKVRVEKKIL